jgi:DNA ligase (NAD+)
MPPKNEVKVLADLLKKYDDEYYNIGQPSVTDDYYDVIKEKLRKLDPKHPNLNRVGADVVGSNKVLLPVYMGSLDKIKSNEKELTKFLAKWGDVEEFVISDKLDGNSGLLVITNNVAKLYTRGDGTNGQDVSLLLSHIKGIPKTLPSNIVVRGEMIISLKDFETLGTKPGSNPRNTAAGIINTKKSFTKANAVTFIAYNLLEKDNHNKYQSLKDEKARMGNQLGFNAVHHTIVKRSALTFDTLSALLQNRRKHSEYEIDGLVVSTNTDNVIKEGKNPSNAFAFKHFLTQNQVEVLVHDVEWNVSKDGLLKPVVIFDKVALSGVNISRATGFNAEYIKNSRIGTGARIIVTRSGDVIPYIVSIVSGVEPCMPKGEFIWSGKDIKLITKNNEQELKELINFFTVLGVDGLGPGLVTKIYEAGYHTIKDFLKIGVSAFIQIPGFQNKATLHASIHSKMNGADCIQIMHASNAFGAGFGVRKLTIVHKGLQNKDHLHTPSMAELIAIPSISEKTATAYLNGLADFKIIMAGLDGIGIKNVCVKNGTSPKSSDKKKSPIVNRNWNGKVVVFTGVRNKTLEKTIEESGGTIGTAISKSTTLVVAKDPTLDTGKLKKARDLNIPIISMEQAMQM